MTSIIEVKHLTKRYRTATALDDVSLALDEGKIYGLLGRNGAGKTTLMSILTAQNFATSGHVRMFGEDPYENARVLGRLCFVRENQKYPERATPPQAFRTASYFYPNWNQRLAERLVEEFQLPTDRPIQRLSRGQVSAVGIVIALAARADVTFFDEPYLGLDAVARQVFYDRLIEDYAESPRTIVLSSHLIDEVANLLEHLIVLDRGRVVIDAAADDIRGSAFNVVGDATAVAAFAVGKQVLRKQTLGSVTSVVLKGQVSESDKVRLARSGVEVAPVSLQQFIVSSAAQPDRGDAWGTDGPPAKIEARQLVRNGGAR